MHIIQVVLKTRTYLHCNGMSEGKRLCKQMLCRVFIQKAVIQNKIFVYGLLNVCRNFSYF